ncbi:hypothetical protein Tco_0557423 [Tanacetum coccineum]
MQGNYFLYCALGVYGSFGGKGGRIGRYSGRVSEVGGVFGFTVVGCLGCFEEGFELFRVVTLGEVIGVGCLKWGNVEIFVAALRVYRFEASVKELWCELEVIKWLRFSEEFIGDMRRGSVMFRLKMSFGSSFVFGIRVKGRFIMGGIVREEFDRVVLKRFKVFC